MTSSPGPMIRVFNNLEALSRAAADLVVSLARASIQARGRFTVALSGGTTPRRLYSLLPSSSYRERIDWKLTHVFWADERCVPPDHEESNFKLVFDTLLAKVPVPKENIHPIRGYEGPELATQSYEEDLKAFFGPEGLPAFDLILLGAGDDGHTASLFPGASTLHEKTRLALPVHLEPPKLGRVTLSLPLLNHAAHVVFLVAGHGKATVVHEIMEDDNPRHYPAGLVHPIGGTVTWLLDREAAENLSSRTG